MSALQIILLACLQFTIPLTIERFFQQQISWALNFINRFVHKRIAFSTRLVMSLILSPALLSSLRLSVYPRYRSTSKKFSLPGVNNVLRHYHDHLAKIPKKVFLGQPILNKRLAMKCFAYLLNDISLFTSVHGSREIVLYASCLSFLHLPRHSR